MAPETPGEDALWVGGWKEVSLVDVLGSVSFTLWTAYCNLSCPWCANYSLAKGRNRRLVPIEEIVEAASSAASFVEYFHVTGGEPMLQFRALANLLRGVREATGLKMSFDTNGTIPKALGYVLERVEVDHVAVDLKAPPSEPAKYAAAAGVSVEIARKLVEGVAESVRLLAERVPFLELRTTMVPGLVSEADIQEVARWISQVRFSGRLVYVVQQFIPYEGVGPSYRSVPATPPEKLESAARRALDVLDGIAEVWVRTIDRGARRVTPSPNG